MPSRRRVWQMARAGVHNADCADARRLQRADPHGDGHDKRGQRQKRNDITGQIKHGILQIRLCFVYVLFLFFRQAAFHTRLTKTVAVRGTGGVALPGRRGHDLAQGGARPARLTPGKQARTAAMHELSLCESLLDVIRDESARSGFSRVRCVRVDVGALSGVEVAALEFGFSAVTAGTLADGAVLQINAVPGKAWCFSCGEAIEIASRADPCPRCGGVQLAVTGGTEMRIRDLEVE